MSPAIIHRLDGLEPDNLLAWLALLGLLRSLEHARRAWHPRVAWTIDRPPLRPRLHLRTAATRTELLDAIAVGLSALSELHEFAGAELRLPSGDETRDLLARGARGPRHTADLWAALGSDAAKTPDQVQLEATPLCLMFGGDTSSSWRDSPKSPARRHRRRKARKEAIRPRRSTNRLPRRSSRLGRVRTRQKDSAGMRPKT